MTIQDKKDAVERLLNVMDELRAKCPWDMKQTIESLRSLTIEEVYELADAISTGNMEAIEEELGDVLLHIVFYAKIGEEASAFDLVSIIDKLNAKLISRHPHIYGDVVVENEDDVKRNWEQLKLREGKKSVLSGVPRDLPAMIKALRIQEKAGKVGFEWNDKADVWKKVIEEIEELKHAEASMDENKIAEEFGDVLFSMINYARFLNVDPESALEAINQKFQRRFQYIENKAEGDLVKMNLEALDKLWNEAKELGL